ncbi:L,D-transpeptidase family protein [Streptomyces olivaceiscleroticus]|uniref:L,D-TPase catalytic domain-containing protein n=1 Tax=Streptomyces olivaceiscleroticus TaxID=68245 RepID=A0ABN0ZBW7_9ACTN
MNRYFSTLLAGATGTATLLGLAAAPGTAAGDPGPQKPHVYTVSELVPGVPNAAKPKDTPDQTYESKPSVHGKKPGKQPGKHAGKPGKHSGKPGKPSAGKPGAQEADGARAEKAPIVEYVPRTEVMRAPKAPDCTTATGPFQKQVERYLKLKVDGKQSPADCKAISAFQKRENISPANGFTGPATWGTIRLLVAKADPNKAGRCPVPPMRKKGEHWAPRVACVDLPRQIMWVQNHDKVIFGPVAIRSGRAGYPTRPGTHEVYLRNRHHYSTIYHSPMPHSQFFDGGQALHGISGNIYSPPGSYGCVNLRRPHAAKLWNLLRMGDEVFVWGRKPAE